MHTLMYITTNLCCPATCCLIIYRLAYVVSPVILMFFSLLLFIILPAHPLYCPFPLAFLFLSCHELLLQASKGDYHMWENFGGENFSELMALKSLARKNLANLLAVYRKP